MLTILNRLRVLIQHVLFFDIFLGNSSLFCASVVGFTKMIHYWLTVNVCKRAILEVTLELSAFVFVKVVVLELNPLWKLFAANRAFPTSQIIVLRFDVLTQF